MSKLHTFTTPEAFSVVINVKKISAILETADGTSRIILDNGKEIVVSELPNHIKSNIDADNE